MEANSNIYAVKIKIIVALTSLTFSFVFFMFFVFILTEVQIIPSIFSSISIYIPKF